MIREILKPNQNSLTLTLPDDLVGKLIEVIAFEIKDDVQKDKPAAPKLKPSQMRGFLSDKTAGLMHEHIKQSRAEWDTL